MKIYHLDTLTDSKTLPASALTIGNFDGVHRGHQAMLTKLHSLASQLQLATAVMIFEPQPREYFAALTNIPNKAPARLTTLQEKQRLLAQHGVDILIVARFDDAFRSLSANEFADLLVQRLGVKTLVLGDDFRFGHDRTGDSTFLRSYGLPVTSLHTVTDAIYQKLSDKATIFEHSNNRISSTRIRQCLQEGNLTAANHLLGYDYSITGPVIAGDKIGRKLAFPTANVALNRLRPAPHGIYGVDVVMVDKDGSIIKNGFRQHLSDNHATQSERNGLIGLRKHSLFGAANIGVRPTIDKPHGWRLEVHFPKFDGDLYNKNLNVRFLHFLHAEHNYQNLKALQAGIKHDVHELLEWRKQQMLSADLIN